MLKGGKEANLDLALSLAEEVFQKHLPGYTLGEGMTNSPFREDLIPSFSVSYRNKKWKFIDFGNSKYRGDIIDFIMLYYGLDFTQAIDKIVKDFNTNSFSLRKKNSHVVKSRKEEGVELDVKSKPFTDKELLWWEAFGISKNTLEKYKVKSCEYIFINKHPILCKSPTYAFPEFHNDKLSYKFYQPENPNGKWLNNHSFATLQGWQQLELTGDLLIIQKSLKDVMLCNELGYNAIAPQSETSFIKSNVLKILQSRFKRIVIMYDNDEPGLREGRRYSEKFNLEFIHIPIEYVQKDLSDFYKEYGKEETIKILKQLI